jgi:hypothetical protein
LLKSHASNPKLATYFKKIDHKGCTYNDYKYPTKSLLLESIYKLAFSECLTSRFKINPGFQDFSK